jgi:hypothetical protein
MHAVDQPRTAPGETATRASHAATIALVRQAIHHAGVESVAAAAVAPQLSLSNSTGLGVGSAGQMVIDPVHSHIFVSRPSENAVDVLSFSGQLLKTITGIVQPWGLVVDNATNYLYIAGGNDEIGRVGLVDLDVVTPPAADSPDLGGIRSITVAAGLIWTAVGSGSEDLASVVPSTGVVTEFASAGTIYQPWLAASPTDTSEFFAGTLGLSPSAVYEVTVSSGVPTESTTVLDGGDNLADLAVTSDGDYVAVAHGSPDNFSLEPTTSSGTEITLPGAATPAAVATSAGQGGLVATDEVGYDGDNLAVYHAGSTTPFVRANTAGYTDDYRAPLAHGLVMSPTGSFVYVVSDYNDGTLTFQAFALTPGTTVTHAVAVPTDPDADAFSNIVALVSFPYGYIVDGTITFSYQGEPLSACTDLATVDIDGDAGAACSVFGRTAGAYVISARYSGFGEAQGSSGSVSFTAHNPGYRTAAASGTVDNFNVPPHGSRSGLPKPIEAIATDFDTGGYWIASWRGDVYGLDAPFHGSLPLSHVTVDRPIRSVAGTADGGGYWLLDANGTVYTYGDAVNFGHVTGVPSTQATVALAATSDDAGYWIVGSQGQVLTFGNADFFGNVSNKGVDVNDVVALLASPDDEGYIIVGANGSTWAFGNAVNHGSLKGHTVVGAALDPVTGGYWLATSTGSVYSFDAPGYGSAGSAVVAIATG